MNYSTAIFLIDDTVRAIKCQYEPGYSEDDPIKKSASGPKTYVFKTLDQSIKVDDIVVVPSGTRWGRTVVKVMDVDVDVDFDDDIQLKWVIAKVDPAPYDALLAQEEKALTMIRSAEKTKKRNALRDALIADNEGLKEFSIQIGSQTALPPATENL